MTVRSYLRSVGDYIGTKNPDKAGKQINRSLESDFKNGLLGNKTPDLLWQKIKILGEIK